MSGQFDSSFNRISAIVSSVGSASLPSEPSSLSKASTHSLIEHLHVQNDPREAARQQRRDQQRFETVFEFTDSEIKEAFDQLDCKKQGFLTTAELALFLDLLGVEASDAEVCEMVRMADTRGLNKVFFSDFQQLIKGELVKTLSAPVPDTLGLLGNQNVRAALTPDEMQQLRDIAAQHRRFDFLPDAPGRRPSAATFPPIPQFPAAQPRRHSLQFSRRESLAKFFSAVSFDFQAVFTKLQQERIQELHLNDFPRVFFVEDRALIKAFYEELGHGDYGVINLAEILVNWIGLQPWTESNRAYLAFMVQNAHKREAVFFEKIVEIFTWLNLSSDKAAHAALLRRVFEKMGLRPEEPIDLKTYEKLVYNFSHLLLVAPVSAPAPDPACP